MSGAPKMVGYSEALDHQAASLRQRKPKSDSDDKDGKLEKPVVLYMSADVLGSQVGAHCGDCWKFIGSESGAGKCIEVEGPITPAHGVCGLYVNGRVFDGVKPDLPETVVQIPKSVAGYVEEGPTHCTNCEHYRGTAEGSGPCERVAGTVEAFGCCNQWEEDDD